MSNDFIKNLIWRGMLHQKTPEIEKLLSKGTVSGYIGFDATAPSLHVGNLATIMLMKQFQLHGHKPIIVIGGATTMVGDPGGKKKERKLLSENEIRVNQEQIHKQLSKFLHFDNGTNSAEILNNYYWFKNYNCLQFLREVGKYIPLSYMLAKESVKLRLEEGLSFAEFSYQLLQGFDFYYLYKNKNVKLQLGGADQWGNLTTGIHLIRRKLNMESHAITTPLITKSDGSKFGKSEQGSIWLDDRMTSPYEFYQFWLNTSDDDAEKYIKVFTLLDKLTIDRTIKEHNNKPDKRILQRTLAKEVTCIVHSENDYIRVHKASEVLFGRNRESSFSDLDERTFLHAFEDIPKISIPKNSIKDNSSLVDLLTDITNRQIFISKGEARRAIKNGGLYINKIKVTETNTIEDFEYLRNKYLIIQKGKKSYYLVILEN